MPCIVYRRAPTAGLPAAGIGATASESIRRSAERGVLAAHAVGAAEQPGQNARAGQWTDSPDRHGDGALLVRPDRFIAWRSQAGADDPRGELANALHQILARPVEAPVTSAA